MPGEHAKLSASSAHRWLVCTAAPTLEAQFPDTGSAYAAEGTEAHVLAEYVANHRLKGWDITPMDSYHDAPEEMQEAATAYADLVLSRLNEAKARCPDPFVALEQRVDFSDYVPGGFGTADCLIIADGTMDVIDFKYGQGVPVSAEDNPQMMLYALGAYYEYGYIYDIHTVRMTIFQPRLSGEPSTAEMRLESLLQWGADTVRPIAQEAYNGPGQFVPGEYQCRFCRAAAQCRARANEMLSLFDEVEHGDLLTDAEAADLLRRAQIVKSWLKDMEKYAAKTLAGGKDFPGWKLVEGRSNRKITDSIAAAQKLMDAGYKESLIYHRELETLTALEKLVGKKKLPEVLGPLLEKPAGKPTLVPESDKRPAYTPDKQLLAAFDE